MSQEVRNYLDGQISELETKLNQVAAKLDILREMRANLGEGPSSSQLGNQSQIAQVDLRAMPTKLRPTQAIREYVRQFPNVRRAILIEELADEIETTSDEPRGVLRTCLKQLIDKGDISVDADDQLMLVDQ